MLNANTPTCRFLAQSRLLVNDATNAFGKDVQYSHPMEYLLQKSQGSEAGIF